MWWLQEASGTPPEPGHATDTRHTLSGGVGGSSSGPREVTFTCEQFVNFLSHLLTQLATCVIPAQCRARLYSLLAVLGCVVCVVYGSDRKIQTIYNI